VDVSDEPVGEADGELPVLEELIDVGWLAVHWVAGRLGAPMAPIAPRG
jgi:hypothetical protein